MTIRRAVPADAGAIAKVHVRSWQAAYAHAFPAEFLAGLDDTIDRRAAWFAETIPTDTHAFLVAEQEHALVAFAGTGPCRDHELPEDTGELQMLYAVPEAWGQGHGAALMRAVIEELGTNHSQAILWVLADNPRGRRFYELAGWRLDGAEKEEDWAGQRIHEVRYVIDL